MSHHLDFLGDLSRPDELFADHPSPQHLNHTPMDSNQYMAPAQPEAPAHHNIPPPPMANLPPPPQSNDFFPLTVSGNMLNNNAAPLPLPSVTAPATLTSSGPIGAPKEKLLPKRARPPKKRDDSDDEDDEPAPKKARKNSPKKEEEDDDDDEEQDEKSEEEVEVTVEWPAQSVEIDSDNNTHYESVKLNGEEYRVGDVVTLWPEDWEDGQDGPVGEIISLVTDGTENYVELKWYYNVAETSIRGLKRKQHNPRELFLSDHIEEQALEAIARKVTIKRITDIPNLHEYCKQPSHYYYTRKWNHDSHDFEDL